MIGGMRDVGNAEQAAPQLSEKFDLDKVMKKSGSWCFGDAR